MRSFLFSLTCILLLQIQAPASGQIIASFTTDADTDVCSGESVPAYIYVSGGKKPYTVVINDDDGEYMVLEEIESGHTIPLSPQKDNTYYLASVVDDNGKDGITVGRVILSIIEPTPVDIEVDGTAFLSTEPGVNLGSDPAGAVFAGPGVAGSTFYPTIASPVGSPHTITCIYTNASGCESTNRIDLHVLYGVSSVHLESGGEIINSICDDGALYYILGSNQDGIPGKFDLVQAGSQDSTLGDHISQSSVKDDEALLDPAGLSGTYDIIYTYGVGQLEVSTTYRFVVSDLGTIGISNLPDTVCRNDNPYPLVPEVRDADPGASYNFSGPGVSGNLAEGFNYDPASQEVEVGENTISLEYISSDGCEANSNHVVYNTALPSVDFTLSSVCLPAGGGTISFTNLTPDISFVESWLWDFGDPGSGDGNYSEQEQPEHVYTTPGQRTISLTATTFAGCQGNFQLDTMLIEQPLADFAWLEDCFVSGLPISFQNRSVSELSDIDTLVWTFKSTSGIPLEVIGSNSPSETIEYSFPSLNEFPITLYVMNESGCSGEITKNIDLKPIQVITTEGYDEDFNGGDGGWMVVSNDHRQSWVLAEPDFTGFNQVPGDRAWFTSLPDATEGYLEHSWVQSPCFDFSGLTRPIIQLDMMRSFVPGTDGAVLQYKELADNGWKTLGVVGEGGNWYNDQGIINEPGGSSFGWGLALFDPDTDWLIASHSLDLLAEKPLVKLRLAIGTGGAQSIGNQGFAFDDIYIGERNRRSVLEHFTNASSLEASIADSIVNKFALDHSGIVYDLHYHMDYPGQDPMNTNNPYPSSVRSFNYGVPGVPYAVFNGGAGLDNRFDFSDSTGLPDIKMLTKASAEIPVFSVDLSVDYLENHLEGDVQVTCTADSFDFNMQLYLVVIEKEMTYYIGTSQDTTFRNVVLDIIPSYKPTQLGRDWSNGTTKNISFAWDYAAYVEDIEDLAVVAFVQDRDNRTILQADSDPHSTVVGIPGNTSDPGSMVLFPNPAKDLVYVNFGERIDQQGQLKIFDISGREVWQTKAQPGYSIQQLDISQLSHGMYIVYWLESGVVKDYRKLVVVSQ